MFWFCSAYKIYIYAIPQSIKYVVALCLKNVHILILKYCIAKSADHSLRLFAGGEVLTFSL